MNRAERRRSAKQDQGKKKTYVLTDEQITTMKNKAVDEATRKAFLMLLSIPIMVLRDKFGFDDLDISKFEDYTLLWYDSVQKGETTVTELMDVAQIKTQELGGRK